MPVGIVHADRPCEAEMSVRAQERLWLNRAWTVSLIYTWLVKTIHNVFSSFSCSLLALITSTVHWPWCFLFLNAANRRLCLVLDSAKHIHCGGPAVLSYPSSIVKKRCSSLSSIARLGILAHPVSSWVSARDAWVHLRVVSANWDSWAWRQTCTYIQNVHWENRSFIQSLALMRLATSHLSLKACHMAEMETKCQCSLPSLKHMIIVKSRPYQTSEASIMTCIMTPWKMTAYLVTGWIHNIQSTKDQETQLAVTDASQQTEENLGTEFRHCKWNKTHSSVVD